MDIAAISPLNSASFVQTAFNASSINAGTIAIQEAGVADTAAIERAAPPAPAAPTTPKQAVQDTLFDFLEQNLFRTLLTPTTPTGNSASSQLAVTEIFLQELLAAQNNAHSNFGALTQLFSSFNQFTSTGNIVNTIA